MCVMTDDIAVGDLIRSGPGNGLLQVDASCEEPLNDVVMQIVPGKSDRRGVSGQIIERRRRKPGIIAGGRDP
jgi:hypothetical protein